MTLGPISPQGRDSPRRLSNPRIPFTSSNLSRRTGFISSRPESPKIAVLSDCLPKTGANLGTNIRQVTQRISGSSPDGGIRGIQQRCQRGLILALTGAGQQSAGVHLAKPMTLSGNAQQLLWPVGVAQLRQCLRRQAVRGRTKVRESEISGRYRPLCPLIRQAFSICVARAETVDSLVPKQSQILSGGK